MLEDDGNIIAYVFAGCFLIMNHKELDNPTFLWFGFYGFGFGYNMTGVIKILMNNPKPLPQAPKNYSIGLMTLYFTRRQRPI